MKKYTHREFLKMMGLGIAFLPFVSCFNSGDHHASTDYRNDTLPNRPETEAGEVPEAIEVTDSDVILLARSEVAYAKFNDAFNKRIHHLPKYIAVCQTEKGVQYAIQKAKSENLKIAIKSGGHSFEGFSSNDGGMVINLSQMKKVTWLDGQQSLVEAGCSLEEIQDIFFAKRRLLPAGSCGTVGIAGLTLGGGYGFFSRKFGLTCDSLLQVNMVAANGKIYNTDEHPELLWACKGGGNGNFGVITSFKFRHYVMPPAFSAYTLKYSHLAVEKFSTLLDTWFDVTKNLPNEAFSAFVLNGNFLTVLITTFKDIPSFENSFAGLVKLADRFSISLKKDLRQAMKRYYGRKGPIYFKNSSGGLYSSKEDLQTCKRAIFKKLVSTPGIVYQINTLGGNIANEEFASTSCYPHRNLSYLSELQSYWSKESQEDSRTAAFEDIQKLLKDAGITAHYRNYPDIKFTDWEKSYYGQNYARLQTIKKKYDPDDLFHYPQSIRLP